MSPADLRADLERRVSEAGSQKVVARAVGISQSHLNMLLTGRRVMTGKVAAKLGYRKVVTFEPLERA